MRMPPRIDQLERPAQGVAQADWIVSLHGQAAAALRSIGRKGRDDGVPSRLQGSPKARDIGGPVALLGEEVEGRPVMPDVVALRRLPDRRICRNPRNA